MSYWTIAFVTGALAILGGAFAFMILRLDEAVEEELRITEEDRSWTSPI